jgi:hypothetical protein
MGRRPSINLFYEEPDPDRWVPFDRYPRRLVRRMVRGPMEARGTMRAFLNLTAGLDRLAVPYRVNDYRHIATSPGELACVFGKPHVLDKLPVRTPILFGTSIYSHPSDNPRLPDQRVIRQVLVPSLWVQRMFAEVWREIVSVWAVGVDTERWAPVPTRVKDIDVVVYDKIYWQREHYEKTLIDPLMAELRRRRLRVQILRYGSYREAELLALSHRARSMIYLSRHETQGIAAQQMLAAGVPLFAWDCGGFWQDPKYYPHQVKFQPVTSVPYWDARCGVKFTDASDLPSSFGVFWEGVQRNAYLPREMILEGFTLEKRAAAYVELVDRYQ